MPDSSPIPAAPAGWRMRDYCNAISMSRSGLYGLPKDQQPRSVYVGRRRVIVESPADFLTRIGSLTAKAAA